MRHFDTKIAVVVRDDLAVWQKLNVACFLSGGLVGAYPELAGERYVDASDCTYGKLIRQPVMVFSGSKQGLSAALRRALERGLTPSIFTQALFDTNNDQDNRRAVAAVTTNTLDLVGLALHGDRRDVDRVVEGFVLHP